MLDDVADVPGEGIWRKRKCSRAVLSGPHVSSKTSGFVLVKL